MMRKIWTHTEDSGNKRINDDHTQNQKTMETTVNNLLGNGSVFKGDIDASGDIKIEGRLIGSLKTNGKAIVGQTGVVEGNISCKQAEIAGAVKGTIKTQELTALKATSKVEVELITKQLLIEVGAVFTGKCTMGEQVHPSPEEKRKLV